MTIRLIMVLPYYHLPTELAIRNNIGANVFKSLNSLLTKLWMAASSSLVSY